MECDVRPFLFLSESLMKFHLLAAAVLGLLASHAAQAQEFDDRWYVTAAAGLNDQDHSRNTSDAPFGALGFGRHLTPNWSLDIELNYQNPDNDGNDDYHWSQYGVSADLRYHFLREERRWHPYVVMGLGIQRSEEEYPAGSFML